MKYYFIGIKGTGMASLATMLYDLGNEVCGSDLEKHFFTEDPLRERGIEIYPFSKDNNMDNCTVIIGNAFLEDFEEVVAARNNPTCSCYRYQEFLGKLMEDYKSISICGSHGKTTTTTMAKTVFGHFKKTGYLIGDGEGFLEKDSEYLCVESCEFRRHFLSYHPEYCIITNIEIDHVDYFKDEVDYFDAYQEFIGNVKEAVVYNGDDEWCRKLQISVPHYSYGFGKDNDYYINDLTEDENGSGFSVMHEGKILHYFSLPFVGHHLLMDVLGVIVLAHVLGFDLNEVTKALEDYEGPKRRYVVEKFKDTIFVDDYAHHPTEVKVTLEASIKKYPKRDIVAVFKPHRASRVLYFAKEFAKALELADYVYLLDFSSIDDKQDGTDIDIKYLADLIPKSVILPENDTGARILGAHRGACMVFMSSKDIYNIAEKTKEYL